jgi:NADH-quinone oxidoreductase subunit I
MADITGLFKSMGVTIRHLFGKKVTLQYPHAPIELPPRVRWQHRLLRHENGLERCIGCSLCAGACPARCIRVIPAANTEENRHSPGERYAEVYEINMLRCIFCGLCEEACPTNAVVLRENFELADYSPETMIFTKEMLTVPLSKALEEAEAVRLRNLS